MTIILLIVLAAFLIYTAYRNGWDVKATIAALGAAALAAWEVIQNGLPAVAENGLPGAM